MTSINNQHILPKVMGNSSVENAGKNVSSKEDSNNIKVMLNETKIEEHELGESFAASLNNFNEEISSLTDEIDSVAKEAKVKQDEIKEAKENFSDKENNLKSAKDMVKNAKAVLDSTPKTIKNEQGEEIENPEYEVALNEYRNAQLQEQQAIEELQEAKDVLEALFADIEELENTQDEYKTALDEVDSAKAEAEDEFEANMAAIQQKREELEAQLAELQAKRDEGEKGWESLSKMHRIIGELSNLSAEEDMLVNRKIREKTRKYPKDGFNLGIKAGNTEQTNVDPAVMQNQIDAIEEEMPEIKKKISEDIEKSKIE